MDEAQFTPLSNQAYVQQPPSGKGKIILPIIVILILLGIIVGGTLYLRSQQESIPTPTPEPTLEATPTLDITPTSIASPSPTLSTKTTPTPTKKLTPTVAPTKTASSSASTSTSTKGLSIRVLNGSGEAGKASTAADYLQGLGYSVNGTGNADNFNYNQTTISIKASKQASLAGLKTDISGKYSVGSTNTTLSESETVDAVVTIGKQ